MGYSRKTIGGPHFPNRVPISPGKWGPGVPIFMGSPKFYDTGQNFRIPSNTGPRMYGSKSFRSQVSAALFYLHTVTFVRTWICADNMQAFRLQAKSQRCYLSQNFGLAVAWSALPPLRYCASLARQTQPTPARIVFSIMHVY